jgi:hypothetical protein
MRPANDVFTGLSCRISLRRLLARRVDRKNDRRVDCRSKGPRKDERTDNGCSELPTSSYASIDEVQTLVRQCAEPRPADDQVKAVILRASRHLGLPFNRTRDIWYGNAMRIDAEEMDRLRKEADGIEIAHAIAHLGNWPKRSG